MVRFWATTLKFYSWPLKVGEEHFKNVKKNTFFMTINDELRLFSYNQSLGKQI